jgi:hypothetical protein
MSQRRQRAVNGHSWDRDGTAERSILRETAHLAAFCNLPLLKAPEGTILAFTTTGIRGTSAYSS